MGFFLQNYSFSDVTETNGSLSIFLKIWEKIFDHPEKKTEKKVYKL